MSVEEVEIIRDMFALMDTDDDGKVTFEELKAGLRKVGSQLADPEIRLLMDVVSIQISVLKASIPLTVKNLKYLSMLNFCFKNQM